MGGAEVTSHGPGSQQQQQGPPPQQQQQQQQQHQYPPRDQTPRIPSSSHQQPPAPNTTSSPPPQSYTPYNPQSGQNQTGQPLPGIQQLSQQQRPQSTYGAQELATSVYDSPIAPQDTSSLPPGGNFYSQDNAPSAPPSAPYNQQPSYQPYGAPDQAPPPVPTGQAPPPPSNAGGYDARHGLPSQGGGAPPSEPQYKPYVPPGAAPDGPSAPADFYRQGGY